MVRAQRVDPEDERANINQKLRLRYLLRHYASSSDLSGTFLYRRLRLQGAYRDAKERGVTENSFREQITNEGKRWLLDVAWATDVENFKKWTRLPGESGYTPSRGLLPNSSRRLVEALGFILADDYPHWGHPLKDDDFRLKQQAIANFIVTGSPQPADIFLGVSPRYAEEITDAVAAKAASPENCRRFLRGNTSPWLGLTVADGTIKRTIEDELLLTIRETEHRAILITSAAGDGKSTLMYRMAIQLFKEGWRVLFKHADRDNGKLNWPLGRSNRARTVLFLDRAEGVVDLASLPEWLDENPSLRVVFAARDMDWQRGGAGIESNRLKHFPLTRLDDQEIDNLARLLVAHDAPRAKASFDELRKRLRHSVHETEYPHMLAAMMTACSGEDFSHVLTSMVVNFVPQELLRWTAICSQSHDSKGAPMFCTGRMMAALHCNGLDEGIEEGERRFETAFSRVRSEIIRIYRDRYDLRHPDIAKFVLHHCYDGAANGVLRKINSLVDDLYTIMSAIVRIRLLENYERLRRGVPDNYLYDFPRSWWSSPAAPDHEVGRQIYEDVYNLLSGSPKIDRRLSANLVMGWLSLEFHVETSDRHAVEVQEKWYPVLIRIFSDLLTRVQGSNSDEEEAISELLYKVYDWWIGFALRHGKIGAIEHPESGTMRAIFRQKWDTHGGRFRGTTALFWLVAADASAEGLGDATEPLPYTHRRLFRDLWNEDSKRSALLAIHWAELEAEQGELGAPSKTGLDIIEPKYSARWVFREAWKEENRARLCNADLMHRWASMEAEAKNLGAENDPSQYTARWVFREAWKEENRARCNADLMHRWASMEVEAKNLGAENDPSQYTARWVFREAWKEENRARCNADLMHRWASMEAEAKNLGAENDPSQYTARWVFREAWKEENRARLCNADLMHRWASMEVEAKNLGAENDPSQYTARWVFREAWKEENRARLCNAYLMHRWASMEVEAKNLGAENDPSQYTARWVFREAWKEENRARCNADLMHRWASMEVEAKNLGAENDPSQYTARWVFREAWREENRARLCNAYLMHRWASMEVEAKNLGAENDPSQYTARWVFREAWKEENRARLCNADLMHRWASMEVEAKNLGAENDPSQYTARWVFHEAWREENRTTLLETTLVLAWFKLCRINFGEDTARWIALQCGYSLKQFLLACLSAERGNMGNFETPEYGTARFIFRELFNSNQLRGLTTWAKYESKANDAEENREKKYSVEWLYKNAKQLSNKQEFPDIEEWLQA